MFTSKLNVLILAIMGSFQLHGVLNCLQYDQVVFLINKLITELLYKNILLM